MLPLKAVKVGQRALILAGIGCGSSAQARAHILEHIIFRRRWVDDQHQPLLVRLANVRRTVQHGGIVLPQTPFEYGNRTASDLPDFRLAGKAGLFGGTRLDMEAMFSNWLQVRSPPLLPQRRFDQLDLCQMPVDGSSFIGRHDLRRDPSRKLTMIIWRILSKDIDYIWMLHSFWSKLPIDGLYDAAQLPNG